jgi:peptidoglycan/LPS O-acetylase OafA/YrhL
MSSWGRTVPQFVTSRVARLWPAYIAGVVLTAVVLVVWPAPGATRPSMSMVLTNLTMAQSLLGVPDVDHVYWSLIIELKFYLIFAVAVVWAGCTYRRVVAFCVAWLTLSVLAQAASFAPLVVLLEPRSTPMFVGGIVLYLIYRFGPSMLLCSMLAVSWILSLNSIALSVDEHRGYGEQVTRMIASIVITACYLVMIATALGWLRWVRWRGLLTLGALSYPIYLLHNQLVGTVVRILPSQVQVWQAAVIAVILILALAFGVNRLVERPGSRAIRRGLRASFERIRAADGAPPSPPVAAGNYTASLVPRQPDTANTAITSATRPATTIETAADVADEKSMSHREVDPHQTVQPIVAEVHQPALLADPSGH